MKKYAIGVLIGFALAFATNSFAAVGDSVSAIFASFNYKVNGQDQTLDSPVLVYDGNSYLRTTQIANMLGYDVTYKADSRTIEFNNTVPTFTPAATIPPSPMIAPSPANTTTPTFLTTTPQPTQSSIPTESPIPSPTPVLTTTPTPSPNPTPIPIPTPSATVTASPTPAPTSNVAACQAIRDNYGAQIAMVGYSSLAIGPQHQKVYELQYYENKELAAAGCN